MSVQPHEPRISGFLNNCSLHCAIPSIIEKLRMLQNATAEIQAQHPQYTLLLNTFGEYYALDRPPNFTQLHDFLIQYHFLDQQIIMGNVLRILLSQRREMAEYNIFDPRTGRYPPIDDQHINPNILHPFGISANIYAFDAGTSGYIPVSRANNSPNFKTINIYYKYNHYEISANPGPLELEETRLYQAYQVQFNRPNSLDKFQELINKLKKQVKDDFQRILQNQDLAPMTPLAPRRRQAFHFFTPEVQRGCMLGAKLGAVLGIASGLYLALSNTITFTSVGLGAIPPVLATFLVTALMAAIFSALFTAAYKLSEGSPNQEINQLSL